METLMGPCATSAAVSNSTAPFSPPRYGPGRYQHDSISTPESMKSRAPGGGTATPFRPLRPLDMSKWQKPFSDKYLPYDASVATWPPLRCNAQLSAAASWPPSQARLPWLQLQSTRCCSDKRIRLPYNFATWPSSMPTVAKAQHE